MFSTFPASASAKPRSRIHEPTHSTIPLYRHTPQTPRPSKSNKTATPAPPFLTLVALALCPCATTSLSSFQSLRSSPSLISRGSWTDISPVCSTGNRKPKYVFRLIPLEATPLLFYFFPTNLSDRQFFSSRLVIFAALVLCISRAYLNPLLAC